MVQEVVLVVGRGIPCFDFLGGLGRISGVLWMLLGSAWAFPHRALELMVAFARGSRRGGLERSVSEGVILGDQDDCEKTGLVFIPMLPCLLLNFAFSSSLCFDTTHGR